MNERGAPHHQSKMAPRIGHHKRQEENWNKLFSLFRWLRLVGLVGLVGWRSTIRMTKRKTRGGTLRQAKTYKYRRIIWWCRDSVRSFGATSDRIDCSYGGMVMEWSALCNNVVGSIEYIARLCECCEKIQRRHTRRQRRNRNAVDDSRGIAPTVPSVVQFNVRRDAISIHQSHFREVIIIYKHNPSELNDTLLLANTHIQSFVSRHSTILDSIVLCCCSRSFLVDMFLIMPLAPCCSSLCPNRTHIIYMFYFVWFMY